MRIWVVCGIWSMIAVDLLATGSSPIGLDKSTTTWSNIEHMVNNLQNMKLRIQRLVVEEALETHPVVIVHGARQTGKTTLCRMIGEKSDRRFLTMDDLDVLDQARRSPLSLLDEPGEVTIDEIQRCPDLLLQIKAEVDRDRRPGRFLLTGSADLLLMNRVSESLAGRAVYVPLPPLTWAEVLERRSTGLDRLLTASSLDDILSNWISPHDVEGADLAETILTGGFPVPALGLAPHQRERWFDSYVQTYLERDLRELSMVTNLPDFRRLMRLSAVRVGTLLNVSSMARETGLTVQTARRYLNLLEVSHLVMRLPAFSRNRGKRLVKAPKFYWTDTGLGAHLAGFSTGGNRVSDHDLGNWFEAWLIAHLRAHAGLAQRRIDLSHWRTSDGHEVDVVIENATTVIPVEIKMTRQPSGRDIRGLETFLGLHPDAGFGVVICRCREARKVSQRIVAIPFDSLLLT